jgi:RimJ/RimL family protein N-acetyltransferase
MIFDTERLKIKKLSKEHVHEFHRIYGDKAIMEKIPAPVCNFEESKAELLSIIDAYKTYNHRLRVWGAFLRDTEQFIGVCAAISHSAQCRDIGYRILKEYWGQGFGTELTDGLIKYLKQDHSLECLTACVDKNNIASVKILEKRMTFEKEEYDSDTCRYEIHYKLSNRG